MTESRHDGHDGTTPSLFQRKQSLHADGGEKQVTRAVAEAKQGSTEALDYLYTSYADNVYSYVLTIVRDEHAAEDVTQQVFAKLLVKIDSYERRNVPFAGWLLRIARNCAIDHLRSSRGITCDEVPGADQPYDETNEHRRRALREALGELPDGQREVVVLRHVLGLSPREIAARMGKSEGAVHTLHHRARRAMRRELVQRDCVPTLSKTDRLAA
jgi:RNA polymerase sigma-70 factor (ECF subfamily)